MRAVAVLLLVGVVGLVGCGGGVASVRPSRGAEQRGEATWYGGKFDGRKTASGERFDQDAFTAAHRTLPFGTKVRVTNLKNGRQVVVKINDRGPYGNRRRIIDVSRGAARALGMIADGVVPVMLEVVSVPGGVE
jgi:rare lipoprotein A